MEKTNKVSFYGLLGIALLSMPALFSGRCGGCVPVKRKPVQQRPVPCAQQVRPTVSAVGLSKVQETNRLVALIKPYFPHEDAESFTAFQCKTREELRKQFHDVKQLIEALPRMTPSTEFKKWQRIFNEALILDKQNFLNKKRHSTTATCTVTQMGSSKKTAALEEFKVDFKDNNGVQQIEQLVTLQTSLDQEKDDLKRIMERQEALGKSATNDYSLLCTLKSLERQKNNSLSTTQDKIEAGKRIITEALEQKQITCNDIITKTAYAFELRVHYDILAKNNMPPELLHSYKEALHNCIAEILKDLSARCAKRPQWFNDGWFKWAVHWGNGKHEEMWVSLQKERDRLLELFKSNDPLQYSIIRENYRSLLEKLYQVRAEIEGFKDYLAAYGEMGLEHIGANPQEYQTLMKDLELYINIIDTSTNQIGKLSTSYSAAQFVKINSEPYIFKELWLAGDKHKLWSIYTEEVKQFLIEHYAPAKTGPFGAIVEYGRDWQWLDGFDAEHMQGGYRELVKKFLVVHKLQQILQESDKTIISSIDSIEFIRVRQEVNAMEQCLVSLITRCGNLIEHMHPQEQQPNLASVIEDIENEAFRAFYERKRNKSDIDKGIEFFWHVFLKTYCFIGLKTDYSDVKMQVGQFEFALTSQQNDELIKAFTTRYAELKEKEQREEFAKAVQIAPAIPKTTTAITTTPSETQQDHAEVADHQHAPQLLFAPIKIFREAEELKQYAASHNEAKNAPQLKLFADTANKLVFFGNKLNDGGQAADDELIKAVTTRYAELKEKEQREEFAKAVRIAPAIPKTETGVANEDPCAATTTAITTTPSETQQDHTEVTDHQHAPQLLFAPIEIYRESEELKQYAASHNEAKNAPQLKLFADTANKLVFFGNKLNDGGQATKADQLFNSALICVRSGSQLRDYDCDEIVSCVNNDILCSLDILIGKAAKATDYKYEDFYIDEIATVTIGTKVIQELEARGEHELACWLGQTIKTQLACLEHGIVCKPEALRATTVYPEQLGVQNDTTTTPRTLDEEMILRGETDCCMAYAGGSARAGEYLWAVASGLSIGAIKAFDPRTMVHAVQFGAGASILVVDHLSNLLAEGIALAQGNDNVAAYFKTQRAANKEAVVKAIQQWGERLKSLDGPEIAFAIAEFAGSLGAAKPAGMLHIKILGAGLEAGKAGALKAFEEIADLFKKNPELVAGTPEGFIFKVVEEAGGIEGAAEVAGGEVMLEEAKGIAKAGKEVIKDRAKVGEEAIKDAAKIGEEVKPELLHKPPGAVKAGGIIKRYSDKAVNWDHIFSADHIKKGIMQLGKNREDIVGKFQNIIKDVDVKGLLKEGINPIKTAINGSEVEIHVFIKDGTVLSLDGYMGHSVRPSPRAIFWP